MIEFYKIENIETKDNVVIIKVDRNVNLYNYWSCVWIKSGWIYITPRNIIENNIIFRGGFMWTNCSCDKITLSKYCLIQPPIQESIDLNSIYRIDKPLHALSKEFLWTAYDNTRYNDDIEYIDFVTWLIQQSH